MFRRFHETASKKKEQAPRTSPHTSSPVSRPAVYSSQETRNAVKLGASVVAGTSSPLSAPPPRVVSGVLRQTSNGGYLGLDPMDTLLNGGGDGIRDRYGRAGFATAPQYPPSQAHLLRTYSQVAMREGEDERRYGTYATPRGGGALSRSAGMGNATTAFATPTTTLSENHNSSHFSPSGDLAAAGASGGGVGGTTLFGGPRPRPFSADTVRDTVLAYLELTGRHDVVAAMLKDERKAGASVPSGTHVIGMVNRATSPPQTGNVSTTAAAMTAAASTPLDAFSTSAGGMRHRKITQKRSHELLKRRLLEREREGGLAHSQQLLSQRGQSFAGGKPSPSFAASVLPVICTGTGFLAEIIRLDVELLYADLPAKVRALPLPAAEPALGGDLRGDVVAHLVQQLQQPMWSAADDHDLLSLPPPRARTREGTDLPQRTLYGTYNQLVQELTKVRITSTSTSGVFPSTPFSFTEKNAVEDSDDAAFVEAFLRQHRMVMPSSVLLAKLLERFLVPQHLRLHSRGFTAYGISIDIPPSSSEQATNTGESSGRGEMHEGSSWMARMRSQSETTIGVAAASATARFENVMPTGVGGGVAASSVVRNLSTGRLSSSAQQQSPQNDSGTATTTTSSSPSLELVTHYSQAATLWLLVGRSIQTRVLTCLLLWLRHHPSHFSILMLHCVLHFVENCCYAPSVWADCPPQLPQLAEFVAAEVHAISCRRKGESVYPSPVLHRGAAQSEQEAAAALLEVESSRRMLTSADEMDDRYRAVWESIPPTLRMSVFAKSTGTAATPPQTWLQAWLGVTAEWLPSFARRTEKTRSGEHEHKTHTDFNRGKDERPTGRSEKRVGPRCQTSEEALRMFNSISNESYVKNLTAAHQSLFGIFPAQDLHYAARRASPSLMSSTAFSQSYLGLLLCTSADLTAWASSLVLHATLLDGDAVSLSLLPASVHNEEGGGATALGAAASLPVTSSRLVGNATKFSPPLRSQTSTTTGAAVAPFGSGDHGERRNSESHVMKSMASVGANGQQQGQGDEVAADAGETGPSESVGQQAGQSCDGVAPASSDTNNDFADHTSQVWKRTSFLFAVSVGNTVHVVTRLVELIVGFLRVNNLHASYSIFRGLRHPVVAKVLKHPKVHTTLSLSTLQRLTYLSQFFASVTQHRDISRGDSHGQGDADGRAAAGQEAADSLEGIGVTRGFSEYLALVPDTAEFPTVPVVQHYIHQLRVLHHSEPTFFACTSVLAGQGSLMSDDMPEDEVGYEGAGRGNPLLLVNWRKLRIIDQLLQQVAALQVSALYSVSSRANVVRFVAADLDVEDAFDRQLDAVIVKEPTNQLQMARRLLSVL